MFAEGNNTNATKKANATNTSLAQGVPVHVNPVIMRDTMADANLGMKILVGHDNVTLAKKTALAQEKGVPVFVNPVIMRDTMGSAAIGEGKILVGPDNVTYAKTNKRQSAAFAQVGNPVENPPMNNWSVNQPSPPHAIGYAGDADLGQNIIVDGHHVHFVQTGSRLNQMSSMGLY